MDCLVAAQRVAPAAVSDLAALVAEAEAHVAVDHPWLRAFAAGSLPDPERAVRTFAVTYNGYSQWFPRYLRMVIDRLSDPAHKALLAENLAEEKGELHEEDRLALVEAGIDVAQVEGVPHSRLFRDFCRAVGIADGDLEQVRPAAAQWRERFLLGLQQGSAAFCVGALGLGTEGVVRTIYTKLLAGIRTMTSLPRRDYVFFELHCLVDDQHQKDLLAIAETMAAQPQGHQQLRAGMRFALDLRAEFWGKLLEATLREEKAA